MAEVMTETTIAGDASATAAPVGTDAAATSEPAPFARTATGYEAFLADSNINLQAIVEKVPSPKVLTERAQSVITSFFPPDEKIVEKEASEKILSDDKAGEEAPPELTASSSSEGSKTKEELKEEKEPSWSEKLSSTCQMDTACGSLELEFMKTQEAPPSKANALTEQGELLAIEGPPAPKPWTRQVSEATTGTLTSVSTKASGLMVALGLATKKDQALITDYYKVKETPEEPKKSLSEKVQEMQSNVTTSAQSLQASVLSTLRLGPQDPQEKEMKQTLITDYDPSAVKEKDVTEGEKPDTNEAVDQEESDCNESQSVVTELKTVGPEKEEDKKSSWSLWKQVKSFFGKMKPEKTPSCDPPKVEIPSCPDVKMPECSEISELKTPRIEIPSYTLFSCNPTVVPEDAMAEAEKSGEPKVEETKPEETSPESPRASHLPWQ